MTYLAIQNLWHNKFRLVLSIGGVALAMMLIVLLNGFLAGIYDQVTAYLDNTPVDLVVAQDGVTNLLSATSLLPSGVEEAISQSSGIEKTTPIVSQFVILDIQDEKVVGYMVGYEPGKGGGPWQISSGRPLANDDEVILDRVLAEEHNFEIGDQINILGESFRIVGLSEGTNSWMASFFFFK